MTTIENLKLENQQLKDLALQKEQEREEETKSVMKTVID
jgi:hypothetical protein